MSDPTRPVRVDGDCQSPGCGARVRPLGQFGSLGGRAITDAGADPYALAHSITDAHSDADAFAFAQLVAGTIVNTHTCPLCNAKRPGRHPDAHGTHTYSPPDGHCSCGGCQRDDG